MIDLHTHTTASDGRCTARELVDRAARAGVTVLAVTDHDTVGGCEEAAQWSSAAGIDFVTGIEITAVRDGADVHILGYFIDVRSNVLGAFLESQRRHRLNRLRQIIDRLRALGVALDAEAILEPALADSRRSAGRPWVARALVESGHVQTTDEAFERWLGRGGPAFVPRRGARPEEVVEHIHEAGGLASLAHPALMRDDAWIPNLVRAGLDAIEAYHSKHDPETTARYVEMAAALGVAVTGGSDYHGDPAHGPAAPGSVSLPPQDYERLVGLS